jgi:hypothetical protein
MTSSRRNDREFGPLPGPGILRRSDGRTWASVLQPVLTDTTDVPPGLSVHLRRVDWYVSKLLTELGRHPFPEFVIHLNQDDMERFDPVVFASALVAHRAERLTQCTELVASVMSNLEAGSLQVAALAARALIETTAVSYRFHEVLLESWRPVHGSAADVRQLALDYQSELWDGLRQARLSSRFYEAQVGLPQAVNVLTHLRQFSSGHEEFARRLLNAYEYLCEITHPNGEAQMALYRLASPDAEGRRRLAFAPSASASPIKTQLFSAVGLACSVIIPLVRDLWWVASDVAIACGFVQSPELSELGVPIPGSTEQLCCCGASERYGRCTHPEPAPLSSEWVE